MGIRTGEGMSKSAADFQEELFRLAKEIHDLTGYNPTDLKQMVNQSGGVQAAKVLLGKPNVSEGFTKLWEMGRLHLALEFVVLQPEWRHLFTADELKRAKKRLDEVKFSHPSLSDSSEHASAHSSNGTYMLTWNPAKYDWKDFNKVHAALSRGKPTSMRWSSGNTLKIPSGARFFMMKQGEEPRGIIGSGYTTSDGYEDDTWREDGDADKSAKFNDIRLEVLLDPSRQTIISRDELLEIDNRPIFWGTPSSGIRIPDIVAAQVESRWKDVLKLNGTSQANQRPHKDDDFKSDTSTDDLPTGDERLKKLAWITQRDGQGAFREALRERYGDGCQISGCPVMSIIQACHIVTVSGSGLDTPDNGLLLRVDLHILFDMDLIGIDPKTLRVAIAPELRDTEYSELEGAELRVGNNKPNLKALHARWSLFKAKK